MNKDKLFDSQAKIFFEYLKTNEATCTMAAVATGIPQKNCTRYKRYYEDLNLLWEIKRRPCKHTGFLASYLSANPEKQPK